MTSEQANLQDKQAKLFEADYRAKMLDLVANKQAIDRENLIIDRENLILMRCLVGLATMFLGIMLSGWTGFYN